MSQTFNGKCHCGQTEWTVALPADSQRHILCHCYACQNLSGGAFTLNQVADSSDFKLTKGNLKVYTYKGDSGNPVDCFMCPNCGANPYHHQHVLGDKYIIRTSLLDGTHSWPKPQLEIYGKEKFSWQPETGEKTVPAGPE